MTRSTSFLSLRTMVLTPFMKIIKFKSGIVEWSNAYMNILFVLRDKKEVILVILERM